MGTEMTKRYAIIEAGIVANIVLSEEPLAENWTLCPTQVAIGWSYNDSKFAPSGEPSVTKEVQEESRRLAYQVEADPLFFKWQAGEATEEEWLTKRQEIRDRYPYPEEN
jgi:hypothetical protein